MSPTTAQSSTASLTHLQLEPWPHAQLAHGGHDPRSAYVERFWLGVLGPSVIWFLRLARRELDAASALTPAVLDLESTARQLGLGHKGGRHSPLMRCVDRCVKFGAASWGGSATLLVRTHLPPVPRSLQTRLPLALREELKRWATGRASTTAPVPGDLVSLAATVVELGHGLHESAERLAALGVDVESARRAAAEAWSRTERGAETVGSRTERGAETVGSRTERGAETVGSRTVSTSR